MIFTKWTKEGGYEPLKLSQVRDVYFSPEEIEALAERFRSGTGTDIHVTRRDGEQIIVQAGCRRNETVGGLDISAIAGAIRRLCVQNNWYTCGSVPMYEHLLHCLIPECDAEEVALDIYENTKRPYEDRELADRLRDYIWQEVDDIFKKRLHRSGGDE